MTRRTELRTSPMDRGKQNGELVIFGARSQVKKALGVTGLSKVLPMFESESDAISSFAMEAELPLAA